jgi:hypothetical protein
MLKHRVTQLLVSVTLGLTVSVKWTDNLTFGYLYQASLWNEFLVIDFGPQGIAMIWSNEIQQNITVHNDGFSIELNGQLVNSSDLGVPTFKSLSTNTVQYEYNTRTFDIRVVYELQTDWLFFSKQLIISTPQNQEIFIGAVTVVDQFTVNKSSTTCLYPKGQYGAYSSFQRFSDNTGMFGLIQNPFLDVHCTTNTFSTLSLSYNASMLHKPVLSGPDIVSDRSSMGFYNLSTYIVPLPQMQVNQEPLNMAERDAVIGCAEKFYIGPHLKQTTKVHIPWTENEHVIDVTNVSQRIEYERIIDRVADLAITHVLNVVQDSSIASISNSTDAWGFEEILWLALGEKIRTNQWRPGDSIPVTVDYVISYASQKNVRLMPYIYPILGFTQNSDWLIPGRRKGTNESSLANIEFQQFLIQTMLDFNSATGAGGYGFDYTFFDDPQSSQYAQWKGWQNILITLRSGHPEYVIDNRQLNHEWGPWTWIAGSYAEPIMSDEQPESFPYYVRDLHTDRVSANRVRQTNYLYRNMAFCPNDAVPGFMFHQTDRHPNASSALHPYYLYQRDFDYLGYQYSLLSAIATGGLNLVVCMLPARDEEEFVKFPEKDITFIRKWFAWTDENIQYLRETKTLPQPPAIGVVDGTYMVLNNEGYVFLFNPNAWPVAPMELTLNDSLGFTPTSDMFLVSELYPLERHLMVSSFGSVLGEPASGRLAGRSVRILAISQLSVSGLIVLGVPGSAKITNKVMNVTGVSGEIGEIADMSVILPKGTDYPEKVEVNGQNVSFSKHTIGIIKTLTITGVHFAGERFSQSQQVGEYDPTFKGGTFTASFVVPQTVLDQLVNVNKTYPVQWDESDSLISWLVPGRLLLFIDAGNTLSDSVTVTMTLDGRPVPLTKSYNSRGPESSCFLGFYADLTNSITPDKQQTVTIQLPSLPTGTFRGLFFDNVTPIYTTELKQDHFTD